MKSWIDKVEALENKKLFCRTVVSAIESAAYDADYASSEPTSEDEAKERRIKFGAPSEKCVLRCARLLKNFWNHVDRYDVGLLYTKETIAKINAIVDSKARG